MNQSEMLARFARETDMDVLMLAGRYTLLEQGALDELLPACERARRARSSPRACSTAACWPATRPAPGRSTTIGTRRSELVRRAGRIADVCERHGVSLPAAALAFPLAHPAVVSVCVGARSAAQVARNAELLRRRGARRAVGRAACGGAAARGCSRALSGGGSLRCLAWAPPPIASPGSPSPTSRSCPEHLQGLFRAARERIGFVPNVFRTYAFRPERLSAWFAHFRLLHEETPGLSAAEREMIAVVVSMANGCLYCLVAHGAALREAWGDPVMADRITLDWRRAEALTERQRRSARSPSG